MASKNASKIKIGLVIGLLGILMMFRPSSCQAQAEIDPDHYDSVDAVTPNTPSTEKLRPNRGADSFRGRFVLPSDVSYAGLILKRGSYSISIHCLQNHSMPKQSLVRFTSDRRDVTVQIRARVSAESNARGASTLVLEAAGERLQLTAIQLNEPRMTLDLQLGQRSNSHLNTKFIPISDTRP